LLPLRADVGETIAHLDHNHSNDDPDNLARLCHHHHWMYDIGLFSLSRVETSTCALGVDEGKAHQRLHEGRGPQGCGDSRCEGHWARNGAQGRCHEAGERPGPAIGGKMTILIFWLCLAFAVGAAASSRGRSGFGWFLLSAILSPLIGLILVLVLPNLRAEQLSIIQHAQLMEALGHPLPAEPVVQTVREAGSRAMWILIVIAVGMLVLAIRFVGNQSPSSPTPTDTTALTHGESYNTPLRTWEEIKDADQKRRN
jgi:hypothetical protein